MRNSGAPLPGRGTSVMARVLCQQRPDAYWFSDGSPSRHAGCSPSRDERGSIAGSTPHGAGLLVGLRLAHDLRRGKVDAARRKFVGGEEIVAESGIVVGA